MTLYYLDTCIWLNLFQKEGDPTKGKPYWEIAEEFIGEYKGEIAYSGIVLRELEINLEKNDFQRRKKFLEESIFKKILVIEEDKQKARKLESMYGFTISFYDLVHMFTTKRIGAILITRDKQLLRVAKENGVSVKKPEELL